MVLHWSIDLQSNYRRYALIHLNNMPCRVEPTCAVTVTVGPSWNLLFAANWSAVSQILNLPLEKGIVHQNCAAKTLCSECFNSRLINLRQTVNSATEWEDRATESTSGMCTVSATLLFSGCSYLGKSTRIIAVIVFVIDPFFYTFLFPLFPLALLCFCRFRKKLLANSRVLANLVSLFVQTNKHPSMSCVPRWCAAMHYYSFFYSLLYTLVCMRIHWQSTVASLSA